MTSKTPELTTTSLMFNDVSPPLLVFFTNSAIIGVSAIVGVFHQQFQSIEQLKRNEFTIAQLTYP